MTIEQQNMGGARGDAAAPAVTAAQGEARQSLVWTSPSVTSVDAAELTMGAVGGPTDGITVES